MLIPSYSRISAFPLIAWQYRAFYDPPQQRGEVPWPVSSANWRPNYLLPGLSF